jgi:hypothetical protein
MNIYIQQIQIQSQEQEKTERKYGTQEPEPKIDHEMSSTKGPKERCSKKKNDLK